MGQLPKTNTEKEDHMNAEVRDIMKILDKSLLRKRRCIKKNTTLEMASSHCAS
jgi:hypothetical protein